MPLIVATFDVTTVLGATSTTLVNVNALGVVSANCATQLAVLPPPVPLHDQFHGPLPVTCDAVPAEHRFALGADDSTALCDDPHCPFTGATLV